MKTSLRAAAVLACAPLLSVAPTGPPSPAAADSVVTATCVDGNYYDGLDTRAAARYCTDALNATGFAAAKLTNTDSTPVLERLPTDQVFVHAGHALVSCEPGSTTNCTAVASGMAGTSPSSPTVTGLLGDYAGAVYQGPVEACNDHGCREALLALSPYNSEMANFRLAVFASCNSAKNGVNGYYSLTKTARDAGVDNVIGFTKKVAWITDSPSSNLAGDAFLRTFWSGLRAGSTYDAALADAAASAGGYGWGSYVHLREAGAPNRLKGPSTPAVASAVASPSSSDWKDRIFAEVTGQDEVVRQTWVADDFRGDPVLKAYAPEGIVSIDPATGVVLSAVREQGLSASGQHVGPEDAERAAVSFVAQFGQSGVEMELAGVDRVEHGSWDELLFTFRDRDDSGLGPNAALVSVNADSGVVASYSANWVEESSTATASISKDEAVEEASSAAGIDQAVVTDAVLDWQLSPTPTRVWSISLTSPPAPGVVWQQFATVELSAETGEVIRIARG